MDPILGIFWCSFIIRPGIRPTFVVFHKIEFLNPGRKMQCAYPLGYYSFLLAQWMLKRVTERTSYHHYYDGTHQASTMRLEL